MQTLFNAVDSMRPAVALTVAFAGLAVLFFAAKWVKKQKWANK